MVNLAGKSNSLTHYTKGTQSPVLVPDLIRTFSRRIFPKAGKRQAPTACMHPVSGSISLPSQGYFSPFPHGTGSLSVSGEYLALEDGPPSSKDSSDRVSRVPSYSISPEIRFRVRGCHPVSRNFPETSTNESKA